LVTGSGATGVDDVAEDRSTESIVNPFVKRVGERISELALTAAKQSSLSAVARGILDIDGVLSAEHLDIVLML
jgi:hypothetical protein